MKKRFQKEVNDALEHFDFEKVHKTMQALNWQWYHPGENGTKVPTIDEIKTRAKILIQEAAESAVLTKDEYVIGTGGFRAEAKYYPKDATKKSFLWVRLAFVLEDWDNCA